MNAIPSMLPVDADVPVVERILAALPAGSPCGMPLRFDPVFTEIRLMREEDDPALPMGQWERPLKIADWAAVEACCVDQLCTRSKHLQLAAWLVEAWTRQHGFAGLSRGLALLEALLRRHWDDLHPMADEDGDWELRLAPLEWLAEAMGHAVHVHVPLVELPGGKPPYLTLAEWERITVQDLAGEDVADRGSGAAGSALPNRADAIALARQAAGWLRPRCAEIDACLRLLARIDDVLGQCLGEAAPGFISLATRLEAAGRVVTHLLADAPCAAPPTPPCAQPGARLTPVPDDTVAAEPLPVAIAAPASAGWRNRSEAYTTLNALAAYLAELEPHSPVPFHNRRAVQWGSMPLPELIAEIIRQEGDLNRLVSFLDIRP